ncbi:MAG: hypothetical protein RBR93_12410 [Aliarcobacter butzleri]|nr:hypothetical protein [Aliarcobacter butzleri]
MQYIKNLLIVFGFWVIGIMFSVLLALSLDLDSPTADSVIRDISLAVMFALTAWYFKSKYPHNYYYFYYASLVALFFGLWQIFNPSNHSIAEENFFSIQSYIDTSAINISKTLPQDIDKETRIDSVSALPNKLKFDFTMKNLAKADINQEYLHTKFVNNLVSKFCKSQQYEVILNNNASVVFHYNDQNGLNLINVEINKDKCHESLTPDYAPIK